eukprot:06843_2
MGAAAARTNSSSCSDETYALMRLPQQTLRQRTRRARSRILFFRRKDLFEHCPARSGLCGARMLLVVFVRHPDLVTTPLA